MGPFHQADHANWRRAPVALGLAGGVVGEEEPALIIERRAIMLSRGGRLGTLAVQALGAGRSLSFLESPADLEDWAHPPVDVVLLDYPRRHRGIVYRQLRQRYRGPVLALLDPGDDGGGLPADRGPLAVLHRPFSGEELTEVLGSLLPAGDPATVGAFEPATPLRIVAELASLPPPPSGSSQTVPPQLLVSKLAVERAEPSLRDSRWDALMRRGLRRWQVLVGATAIVLFGLAFAAPDPCTSGCANLAGGAGGAERNALAVIAGSATAGVGSSPRAGAGGSAASSTASTIIPGVPPPATIPTLGGLLSGLGGGGTTSPLLIAPVGSPAPLPAPAPAPTTTTTPATTTTRPTATTKPPTTTTKPPAPTTTAPPPPPPTTAPPSPTTEPPPPPPTTTTTTEPPPPPPTTTTTAPA